MQVIEYEVFKRQFKIQMGKKVATVQKPSPLRIKIILNPESFIMLVVLY